MQGQRQPRVVDVHGSFVKIPLPSGRRSKQLRGSTNRPAALLRTAGTPVKLTPRQVADLILARANHRARQDQGCSPGPRARDSGARSRRAHVVFSRSLEVLTEPPWPGNVVEIAHGVHHDCLNHGKPSRRHRVDPDKRDYPRILSTKRPRVGVHFSPTLVCGTAVLRRRLGAFVPCPHVSHATRCDPSSRGAKLPMGLASWR